MNPLRRFDAPFRVLSIVEGAYRTGRRVYHDLTHVAEVLAEYDRVAESVGWRDPREVYFAILFHDAIYVAGAHDNETRSADLARETLAGTSDTSGVDVARVATLIQKTALHGKLARADVDRDEALFLDCDMAILGAAPARFLAYDAAIAEEYAAIPPEIYIAGRRAFLERLLASERIFLSDFFHELLDARARDNLRNALTGRRDASRAPRGA
jgi:predicted metal-dependent HD superfamily phosphohydrolase